MEPETDDRTGASGDPMGGTNQRGPTPSIPQHGAGVVLILSRLELVSQTIAAGLRSRGIDVDDMAWEAGVHRALHDLDERDTVFLLVELDDRAGAMDTQALISRSRARFLVLTQSPEDAVWGALLSSGAAGVMPTQTSLSTVNAALHRVRRGESPMPEGKRAQLVDAWVRRSAEDDALRARMNRLSAREHTVIELLASGCSVAEIGAELSIAEGTARSHVKAIRRKLDVDSQLAAVAVVHRLESAIGGFRPVVPRPRRPRST